jgi:hypothetical protein
MMEAIDDLSKSISDQPRDVHTSLDFILKWSTLRIVDNNVQALGRHEYLPLTKSILILIDYYSL